MRALGRIIRILGNVVGVLLSVVISAALLAVLIAAPILSGASALTRSDTIRQVVREIDFAQVVRRNLDVSQLSEDERAEMELVLGFAESEAFGDLIDLYAQDLTAAFEGTEQPGAITEDALKEIVHDNLSELIEIVRKAAERAGEDLSDTTDEELEVLIYEYFDEAVDRFLEMVPSAEQLRDILSELSNVDMPDFFNTESTSGPQNVGIPQTDVKYDGDSFVTVVFPAGDGEFTDDDGTGYYIVENEDGSISYIVSGPATDSGGTGGKLVVPAPIRLHSKGALRMSVQPGAGSETEELGDEVINIIRMAQDGTLTLLLVAAIAALALLIFLLRWPRFKGFMWVAVVLLIGAISVLLLSGTFSILLQTAMGQEYYKVESLIAPVMDVIKGTMLTAALIYAVVAVALIVLFVVLRKVLRRHKTAQAQVVEQPPMDTEAPTAEIFPAATETPAAQNAPDEEETPAAQAPAFEETPVVDEAAPSQSQQDVEETSEEEVEA